MTPPCPTRRCSDLVRVPRDSGGGVAAATTQSSNELEESRYKLDAATFELTDELEKQFNLVEMSPRRIDAYARAASAAAERVQATRRSIVGGERTNLDALDAERQRDRKSTRLNSSH